MKDVCLLLTEASNHRDSSEDFDTVVTGKTNETSDCYVKTSIRRLRFSFVCLTCATIGSLAEDNVDKLLKAWSKTITLDPYSLYVLNGCCSTRRMGDPNEDIPHKDRAITLKL